MAEIVNLRRARKTRRRDEEAATAATNRVLHGRSKAERSAAADEKGRTVRFIDGHRRTDRDADDAH